MNRVGIFSGTFDPVHKGHIAFALEAAKTASLDKVYFLPEQTPRYKHGVTHYAHRVAMLRLAVKPYKNLDIMELPDRQLSVNKSLPRIKKELPETELYLLVGSDLLGAIAGSKWPNSDKLLEQARLIVGVRTGSDEAVAKKLLNDLNHDGLVVDTDRTHASSRDIRSQLARGTESPELLASLKPYIAKNWLYVSVDAKDS